MVQFLLYLSENRTLEVKADHYWHEDGELVFSLDGVEVVRLPSNRVLLIDEVRPEQEA